PREARGLVGLRGLRLRAADRHHALRGQARGRVPPGVPRRGPVPEPHAGRREGPHRQADDEGAVEAPGEQREARRGLGGEGASLVPDDSGLGPRDPEALPAPTGALVEMPGLRLPILRGFDGGM
ncbi:unnamed protein product, partial [Prorocentrum cordatum]